MSDCRLSSYGEDRGYVLVSTIIVLTILLTVIAAVFAITVLQNRLVMRDLNRLEARYAAEGCVYEALKQLQENPLWRPDSVDVLGPPGRTCSVKVEPHGGFLYVYATTRSNKVKFATRALVGEVADTSFDRAVVLGNVEGGLHLVTDTEVTGDIVAGPQGVRTSQLNGRSFTGNHEGKVLRYSQSVYPTFDDVIFLETIDELDSLLCRQSLPNRVRAIKADLTIAGGDTLIKPGIETLLVDGDLKITGRNHFRTGMRIAATGNIFVEGVLAGNNLLLYAQDSVIVRGKAELSGQLLSRRLIRVGDDAFLRFPSTLFVAGVDTSGERRGEIYVENSAVLEGNVIYPAPTLTTGSYERGGVILRDEGTIVGAVYSASTAQISSTLLGTAIVNQTIYFSSPTTYYNWLADTRIDVSARPQPFIIPVGFAVPPRLEVVNWEVISRKSNVE